MASQTQFNDPTAPIPPARFASALKDLPLSSIALKAAEIRNSLAHLAYSNQQLESFAHPPPGEGEGDQDCVDAIQENLVVMERMRERLGLVKAEVERRGVSWREFAGPEGLGEEGQSTKQSTENKTEDETAEHSQQAQVNGNTAPNLTSVAPQEERHAAWSDGTFEIGRIRGGPVVLPRVANNANGVTASASHQGGSIGDDDLRRRMEERMREASLADDDEDEGGMHL